MAKANSKSEAAVEVALGVTLSMPGYQSVRIDVGTRIPCGRTKRARERAYTDAFAFCNEKVRQEGEKYQRRRNEKFPDNDVVNVIEPETKQNLSDSEQKPSASEKGDGNGGQ